MLNNGTQSRDPLTTKGKWSHQEMPNPTPIVDQIWLFVRIHHHSFFPDWFNRSEGKCFGVCIAHMEITDRKKKIHSMLACKETRKRPFLPQTRWTRRASYSSLLPCPVGLSLPQEDIMNLERTRVVPLVAITSYSCRKKNLDKFCCGHCLWQLCGRRETSAQWQGWLQGETVG